MDLCLYRPSLKIMGRAILCESKKSWRWGIDVAAKKKSEKKEKRGRDTWERERITSRLQANKISALPLSFLGSGGMKFWQEVTQIPSFLESTFLLMKMENQRHLHDHLLSYLSYLLEIEEKARLCGEKKFFSSSCRGGVFLSVAWRDILIRLISLSPNKRDWKINRDGVSLWVVDLWHFTSVFKTFYQHRQHRHSSHFLLKE